MSDFAERRGVSPSSVAVITENENGGGYVLRIVRNGRRETVKVDKIVLGGHLGGGALRIVHGRRTD